MTLPYSGTEISHQFDHLFWVGDLNYRVDTPFHEVVELSARREWAKIAAQVEVR